MLLSHFFYGKDIGTDKYQWQSGKIESAYGAGRGWCEESLDR